MRRQLLVFMLLLAITEVGCRNKPDALDSQTLQSADDPQTALDWVHKADIDANSDDLAGAAVDCDKAIALDSNLTIAYYFGGRIKIYLDHYVDAITYFDKAIVHNPKDTNAYNCRGYAYFKLGKTKSNYKKAVEDFYKSVELGGSWAPEDVGGSFYHPPYIYIDDAEFALKKADGR